MITTGERIKQRVKALGLKQVQVCRAVGLSPSRLSNYMSGSREPDLETLSKIARFLDADLNYFDPLREKTDEEILVDNMAETMVMDIIKKLDLDPENIIANLRRDS